MKLESNRAYKVSGNIDLQVEIEPGEFDELTSTEVAESSEEIHGRVLSVRNIEQE